MQLEFHCCLWHSTLNKLWRSSWPIERNLRRSLRRPASTALFLLLEMVCMGFLQNRQIGERSKRPFLGSQWGTYHTASVALYHETHVYSDSWRHHPKQGEPGSLAPRTSCFSCKLFGPGTVTSCIHTSTYLLPAASCHFNNWLHGKSIATWDYLRCLNSVRGKLPICFLSLHWTMHGALVNPWEGKQTCASCLHLTAESFWIMGWLPDQFTRLSFEPDPFLCQNILSVLHMFRTDFWNACFTPSPWQMQQDSQVGNILDDTILIMFKTTWGTWTYTNSWDLMRCTPGSRGNWQT